MLAVSTDTPIAHRALIVDDETVLGEMLSMAFRYEGWASTTAACAASAMDAVRSACPDAVVLDVTLPDVSGLDLLPILRERFPSLPVLLLTAKAAVEDRIAGLAAGADDYVTKPFSIEEVMLRLRALLRRGGPRAADSGNQLVVGDLVLCEDSREVTRAGDHIDLTATEFELLRFLMLNANKVLSKEHILDQVWSYDFGGRSNVVALYISYLRKKIDGDRGPLIHTHRGAGYILKAARN
jgi:two-component system OmpR family response regulator